MVGENRWVRDFRVAQRRWSEKTGYTRVTYINSSRRSNLSFCHMHRHLTLRRPTQPPALVGEVISTFSGDKNGPRSFFSQSFPPVRELISAVDIYHRNRLILTKTEETETTSDWFRCSPFRIDLLDPKDVVPTQIPQPDDEAMCTALMEDMTLSWIVIDPFNKQSVNLSSHKPVSVHHHWLSGEVNVCFVSILGVAGEVVQFGIVVNCGGSEDGEMQVREVTMEVREVREVTMEVEDMDGRQLNGRDSFDFFFLGPI